MHLVLGVNRQPVGPHRNGCVLLAQHGAQDGRAQELARVVRRELEGADALFVVVERDVGHIVRGVRNTDGREVIHVDERLGGVGRIHPGNHGEVDGQDRSELVHLSRHSVRGAIDFPARNRSIFRRDQVVL